MSYEKEEEKCYLIQLASERHKTHWDHPNNQNILYYTYDSYRVMHRLNISKLFSIWGFH